VALLVTGQLAAAQPPTLTNAASRSTRAGALEPQVTGLVTAASEPAWIAGPCRRTPGRQQLCWNSTNGVTRYGCQLEDGGGAQQLVCRRPEKIDLESGRLLVVLVRAENKAIQKVAAYSTRANWMRAGAVAWIDGVKPADSIALLSPGRRGRTGREDPSACSAPCWRGLHADDRRRALISLAESPRQLIAARRLSGWARAGQKAAAAIVNAIQNDPDTR